jgi:capsular polysaccharide biosynthesis protein
MELRRYLSILRRHLLLVLVTLAVALTSGWLTTSRVKVYVAQATIFVGRFDSRVSGNSNTDPLVAAQLAATTFTKMITSLPTAELAVQNAGIPRKPKVALAETSASLATSTTLIDVKVADVDPVVAANLANAEASAFTDLLKQLEPDASTGGVGIPASIFETARVPTKAQTNSLKRNIELAAIFGVIVAAALAILLEYIDLTVRGVLDAQRRLELPVLAAIPLHRARA